MITVIADTGIHSNMHEMSTSTSQLPANGRDQSKIVARTEELVRTLGTTKQAREAIAEGREIAAIVQSLGLPDEIVAAARLCPLVREEV